MSGSLKVDKQMWYLEELPINRMYVKTKLCAWFGLLFIVLVEEEGVLSFGAATSCVTLFRLLISLALASSSLN